MILRHGIVCFLAVGIVSCAGPRIPTLPAEESDPQALVLLQRSQRAHGADAFARLRDVSVRYEGRWASIGPRFQPVLVDKRFRSRSEERLLLPSRVLAQTHEGPGGVKRVLRAGGAVSMERNGMKVMDSVQLDAAALVADAYVMFLLGPHYFARPGVTLLCAGEGEVDGLPCDQVLAILRPGFGAAVEDRVLLSIDRGQGLLRRVRLTLNGLESTRGAEVDVTFRQFERVAGVLWPRDYDERIRSPFDLPAHRWRLAGLDVNRGYGRADLTATALLGKAAPPARALP